MSGGNVDWRAGIGNRFLVTDKITHVSRDEWTLLEVSSNGEVGKFRNELAGTVFWTDLDMVFVIDVLPNKEGEVAA